MINHGCTLNAPLSNVKERKKEIPYIEGRMKDIGARVGYTVI